MKLRVAPTLHPSHIQRGAWEKIYYLVEEIRKAHAQAWKPALSVLPTRYVPHPTVEQARGVLRLGDRRPMVLDIETRGTEGNAEIVCCGVGRAEREAVCLPWREPFKGLLRSALMDPSSMKVAHNIHLCDRRHHRAPGASLVPEARQVHRPYKDGLYQRGHFQDPNSDPTQVGQSRRSERGLTSMERRNQ